MGYCAIDKANNKYIPANKADKSREYICCECKQPVIFKKGKIKKPHFAHKSETTCRYYSGENHGESEIHKEAKSYLKDLLETKRTLNINLTFTCKCEHYENKSEIIIIEPTWQVIEEYKHNNCSYDVAVLDNDQIKYVFEIKHTHATTTIRPEPWYEFSALEILLGNDDIFNCKRKRLMDVCIDYENIYKPVKFLPRKNGVEFRWEQISPCINCKRLTYSPIYNTIHRKYYSLCKLCRHAKLSICNRCGKDDHPVENCKEWYDVNYIVISN